ncbi:hypothetical protein PRIC2_004996 [Phytophthora ramorum]|uniref:Uncharacterized protein n=1 Tax=Phytophthora ramorum TaxID=164328 RepID=H3GIW0_PHYRM|nr:hypothetical protein KRP23_9397 [Phytophthora ramorum]
MDGLESARLQLLLGMAFGPGLLEGQAAWRDVPEVVRRSFLLLAKELRRLHRLLAANLQNPNPALQHAKDPDVQDLQSQLALLRMQIQDAQDQADARHRRTNQKLSSLWGEVAATAEAAADAQAPPDATSERLSANWETQLLLLQRRMDEQDRSFRTCRVQDQQVDQALHELQKGHVLCRQELRRLQRQFLAHDHRVVGTTVQDLQDEEEVRAPQDYKEGSGMKKKQDRAGHVLLHERFVEALKLQDRGGLSPVAEHGASASG